MSKNTATLQSMPTSREIKKSSKLEHVCYDIHGPVLRAANEMEEQGHKIIKLNIGNPAPFGFEAPQEIINDVALNLPNAIGYVDSKVSSLHVKRSASTTNKRYLKYAR